jgi:L-malate glycosyltransferase
MKVLHLTGGGDTGGAKPHILSLIQNLSKNIDVKMISFRYGPFASDASALGINVEVIQKWTIISEIIKVIRIIKKDKYEIIHSHGAKANLVAIIAKLVTRLPTVTTVHSDYKLDYMHSLIKRWSYGFINTIALRFFNYYTCVSKNLKISLIKRHFPVSSIFTIPNGIDFDNKIEPLSKTDFARKYNLNFSDNDVVVGILARLTAVKGLNIFIKAAAVVIKKNPNVRFLVAGAGEDRKALERLVEILEISNNVFFLGHVIDTYSFINFIDINVLSSLSEGFPFSILEGSRQKKATISSNVGGIPDLIESGQNGYLFNPGDYEKLSQFILDLVNNPDTRIEMGEKIYEKAKTLYSINNMCQGQLNIYNNILFKSTDSIKYDVMISGYYGFHNSGDDAILKAIIDNLRIRKEDIRVMVLSKTPMETKLNHFVDSINRINLLKIFFTMKKTKLFINGGGNLMQDSTSTRSIMYYLATTWVATLMHCKVMVYANGIGPINKNFNRKLTQLVLNKVDIITLRENLSKKDLLKLKITKPSIIVTADPALTVASIDSNEIDSIFKEEGINLEGKFVGFSARICESNITYNESIIAQIADYMIEKYGIIPVFIPMQPKDLIIIDCIISKMKGVGYAIRGNYDASSIIGIISRMELLIGMRLHSLIYAASLGIPVIGLVYDSKVEAFIQYFQQTSAGDVRQLTLEKFTPLVDHVWDNRKRIKTDLIQVTIRLKEKAYENSRIAIELLESK